MPRWRRRRLLRLAIAQRLPLILTVVVILILAGRAKLRPEERRKRTKRMYIRTGARGHTMRNQRNCPELSSKRRNP
uniref:Putative secreted protein n=1 Tax=Anopheles darlingi TaxID=43151 RepID=A0A2M4DMK4_ANODA